MNLWAPSAPAWARSGPAHPGAAADRADHRAVDQDRGEDLPAGTARRHGQVARGQWPCAGAAGDDRRMDKVAVLDFGAQYTQLIARRIRERGVYSEIFPPTAPLDRILLGTTAVMLSGRPDRACTTRARRCRPARCSRPAFPCSASATACRRWRCLLGGHVVPARTGSTGKAQVALEASDPLFEGVVPDAAAGCVTVWMSHGDTVLAPPPGLRQPGHDAEHPGRRDGRRRSAGSTPCSSIPRWRTRRRVSASWRTSSSSSPGSSRLVDALLRRPGGRGRQGLRRPGRATGRDRARTPREVRARCTRSRPRYGAAPGCLTSGIDSASSFRRASESHLNVTSLRHCGSSRW